MKKEDIPVTGLILHFRTPEKTISCIQSQQEEGIHKVVVIDNSEDNGKSILSMQGGFDALREKGLEITVINPNHNLGFSRGVAIGLEYISTQPETHVLLINSDAKLSTGSLIQMRSMLNEASIVAPKILQQNGLTTSPFSYYDRLLGLITQRPLITPVKHASGCCLLLHSIQVGLPLFDQDFFFYGEDAMFGFEAKNKKISIRECPEAVISHATSTSAKNGSIFYEYHMSRAHWLLAKKLARNNWELSAFVAARCITLPLRATVRAIRSQSFTAWRGLFSATIDVLMGRHRTLTPPVIRKKPTFGEHE